MNFTLTEMTSGRWFWRLYIGERWVASSNGYKTEADARADINYMTRGWAAEVGRKDS